MDLFILLNAHLHFTMHPAIKDVVIPKEVERIGSNAFGISNAFGRHKYDYYGKHSLEIAFAGHNHIYVAHGGLSDMPTIYCLKSSAIYQELCKKNYKLKALSEYEDS